MNHCNFAFYIVNFQFCCNEIRISFNKVNKILKIFCCTRIRITVHFLGWFLVRITILLDISCRICMSVPVYDF
jgi:hypothetical protein